MKTKLVIFGTMALALAGLAGCKGGNKSYDPDNFLPNGTEENPYQIVKDPITIEVFAPKSPSGPSYASLKMFKHLSKVTNINFEFTTPDSSAYQVVRSGIWQSKEIPDFFLFNNSISELVQFAEQGFPAYVPLNDPNFSFQAGGQTIKTGNIIENYMPTYSALLKRNFDIETNEDAVKCASLNDGSMYSTLSVHDVPRDSTYKIFINDSWIASLNENYGLNLPRAHELKTLDEFYQVLRAFKQYDANDNGDPNDEIPVTSKSLEFLRNYILQAFGYVAPTPEIRADWSAFDYVPLTNQYREYLKFANRLYSEGLLHEKTFTLKTDAQLAQYGQKDQLGCFVAAAPYLITGYELEDQYTTIPPVRASSYTGPLVQLGFGYFHPDGACIPQSTPYIREIARLIDILYSDLGVQLISYGVEGEDWTWDDEAHTSFTFNVPEDWPDNQEQYRATITPNVGMGSALYWQNEFIGKMNDEIIHKLNEQSTIYAPYLKTPEPYEIKMNYQEYDAITKIKAALDPQLEYLECCLVKGQDGYDPNDDASYGKFIEKIKGYEAERLLECYNSALARYKEKN